MRTGKGLVLGKFLPPHQGHIYLCEFAQNYVEDLAIVVGTLKSEPIPGVLRHGWMTELFPGARVLHLTDENPQYPHEHPDFWQIWKASLTRILPWRPDYVFASELYGFPLAEILGAQFVPVDVGRTAVPISGSQIRADPWSHWDSIPPCVRPFFLRRVCIFGPESTGKSTLTAQLARHFQTVCVPEYARTWLEPREGRISPADIPQIARGQIAAEDALARHANRLLFCDTDLLTTAIWSEVLFEGCPAWIRAEAQARRYDLTLLLDVDVPWVGDCVRYLPDERRSFFARCEAALEAAERPYVIIRGSWEERFSSACAAVNALIRPGEAPGSPQQPTLSENARG